MMTPKRIHMNKNMENVCFKSSLKEVVFVEEVAAVEVLVVVDVAVG